MPLLRAGKSHCAACPAPLRPTASTLGNLVLGTDSEQVARIEAALLRERQAQVGALLPPPAATAVERKQNLRVRARMRG